MIVIPAALCLIASVSASTSQIVAPAVPVVAAPASPPAPASVPVLAAAPTAVATPGLAPAPLSVPIVAAKAATPLVSAPVQAAPARIAPQPVASVSPAPVVEDVRPEQATGRVYGEVRDQFGGVLPGVTVTTHTAGGSPDRSTHTNARGQFSIDNLPAGTYTVQAGSMPGFKTVSVSVRVIADDVAVPIQLQVGDLTQHVSVIASKTAAPSRPILVVRPLACETSADCLRAAGDAYAAGDLRTTDALISQALDRRRAEQPGLFQVTPRRQTFVITNSDVVRVGGDIKAPSKTHDVVPLYPPEALAAGIDGVVVIDATIAKDGSIWEAHIVNGKRELNLSALDAVRLWKFTPTLLDGVPVNVSATITIDFSLR